MHQMIIAIRDMILMFPDISSIRLILGCNSITPDL